MAVRHQVRLSTHIKRARIDKNSIQVRHVMTREGRFSETNDVLVEQSLQISRHHIHSPRSKQLQPGSIPAGHDPGWIDFTSPRWGITALKVAVL